MFKRILYSFIILSLFLSLGKTWIDLKNQVFAQSPEGTLSANPNPCQIPQGSGTCRTTISWQVHNATDTSHVFVYADGSLFANGADGQGTGSQQTGDWISSDGTDFTLKYADTTLATLHVSGTGGGQHTPPPPPPAHDPPPPLPPPPAPNPLPPSGSYVPLVNTSSVSCITGSYNQNGITISWDSQIHVNFVDISPDSSFNSFYNKNVSDTSGSTTAVDGFNLYPGTSGPLSLIPNTTYYVRLYNGTHSTVVSFNIPACSATPPPPPSGESPSPSPSAPQTAVFTTDYRLAESESGLSTAQWKPYASEPLITNFTLANETPGTKQIWVEFKDNSTSPQTRKEHVNIELIGNNPVTTSIDCTLDINRQNVKVTIKGQNFGSSRGKLTSDNTDLDILDWKNNQLIGILKKPGLPTDENQRFNFSFKRSGEETVNDLPPCRIDTSLIALGAKVFCREEGKFDISNVKISIKDQNNSKTEEAVTISQDGIISNLKTKLQSGKKYAISIKAPFSLRRNAIFTAGQGTTIVTEEDGSPFILPIGDIAPANGPDGTINAADRAVLSQQWVASKNASKTLTGDFNRDSRVNSFDWACMRYDFNKSDDPKIEDVQIPADDISDDSGGNATASPSPAGSCQSDSDCVSGLTCTRIFACPANNPNCPGFCTGSNFSPSPSSSPGQSSGITTITIQNSQFSPSSVTIRAGTTVRWQNDDTIAHTVTKDVNATAGPQTGTIPPTHGDTFVYSHPGTYTYHCSIHPEMTGTVIVTQ